MLRISIIFMSFILLLSACMIKHPQSAQEFREGSIKAKSVVIERYQVNRSFSKISQTIKKMANKCLRKKTHYQSLSGGNFRSGGGHLSGGSYQSIVTTYIPTVISRKSRVELHLQQRHRGMVKNVSKAPAKGYFMYVLDVSALGKRKSKVSLYRPRWGHKHITRALKGWVDGTNLGCPDLAK